MIKLNQVDKIVNNDKQKISILKKIEFVVDPGDFVVITGASGSGKSTLLNIIGGLDLYDNGIYTFNEKVIQTEKDRIELRKKEISLIVQNFALLPNMTVLDNIYLAKRDVKYAKELLERLGIFNQKNKKVKYLSGGEKQRVAIARALVKRPKLLLADEPTGALDSENSAELIQLLQDLNTQQGLTVILVTHDLNIAKKFHNRFIMKDGTIARE